jgi:hypothetical protein
MEPFRIRTSFTLICASQSHNHLAGRSQAFQVISTAENDTAVYSATVGACFTPPETPNVGSPFAAFHGYAPSCMSLLLSFRELLARERDMLIGWV